MDACAAAEIIFKREKSKIFIEAIKNASQIISLDLFVPELTNTLWKYRNVLGANECKNKIQEGLDLISQFFNSKDLWEEALAEATKNDHSAYDMFYMVLARRNNGTLMTNDGELAKICNKNKINLIY
jgi:predicted nucleic acid-binding protein